MTNKEFWNQEYLAALNSLFAEDALIKFSKAEVKAKAAKIADQKLLQSSNNN